METSIISRTDTEAQLTVSLNEAELKAFVAHVYDELRPRVKAAGFRPGKAPNMIVERELGSATVQSEVIDHALQESYSKAIREHDLQVVASPEVSIEKFVPFTELSYEATVQLMPKVELADYRQYRLPRPEAVVEPAEIDEAVESLRQREAKRLEVERPAKQGDEVTFDFDGTKDGAAVPGASAKGHKLTLGSGQFIPGFEEEIIGLKAGDDKTFDITFPSEYHEASLAGQVVTFAIKLHTVTELVLPKIDAEFLQSAGGFKTEVELRDDICERLQSEKDEQAGRAYEEELLNKLVAESKVSAPPALVDQQLERLKAEFEQNLTYSGLDLEKYAGISGKTADELVAEMRPEAERRVKLAMVMTEVASAEQVTLTAEELDAEIERLKLQYPDDATQTELDNPRTREEIYNHLMASRVIGRLLGYAEGLNGPLAEDEGDHAEKSANDSTSKTKAAKASKPGSHEKA